jgi:hypothetical protein
MINDAGLQTLVEGRVFPAQIAEIPDHLVVYPLITLRGAGGTNPTWVSRYFPLTYQIWCWSKEGYAEAIRIYETMREGLTNQRFSQGEAVVVCKVQNTGQRIFDPTASLYYVSGQIKVHSLDVRAAT